ncbi:recombination and DNA strand exchange inhibitor protein [Bacteroidales bacterium Barb6XT]|nr:recombination and DNA strand exchange inhibitor protein [Bacteroidales bacterium Barb6XT]
MAVQIGDKVRFLNAVGGGVVRCFRGKDQVLVEDEDGFELPVLIKECVAVGDGGMPTRTAFRKPPAETPKAAPPALKPTPKVIPVVETPEGERLNVCLACLPIDPKALQQSRYETYFVNDSNYYLFYNYMSRRNNSWYSRANGLVEPNTRIFLEEFGKEDLNDLERICVQLIAFKKDKPYSLKNAVSVELRVDTVKFYKLHSFIPNDFFDEDALIFPVIRKDMPEKELVISAADLQEAMQQKVSADRNHPAPRPPAKHQQESSVIEIDLHIAQLLDNTSGMSNADMLNYQLDKFRETLAAYVGKKGQQLIFIHGKGDGILRKAIEQELHTKYRAYYYQDASFREYGFGATMVTVR